MTECRIEIPGCDEAATKSIVARLSSFRLEPEEDTRLNID
jgi:hypothetical protein